MPGKVPFDSLRFRPQRRTYAQRQSLRDVEGFDTETEKGYARIAANSQAWTEIASIDDVFSFLLHKRHRDTINVLWNLSFDVECLFKWSKDILIQFAENGEATYEDYELHYIKGKCLAIRDKAKHTYRFFDIAQFYLSSLAKATIEYLHEEPHEFKSSRATLFQDHPLPAIGNYCAQDARQTRDLGTLLMRTIQKIGLSSNRPYSCGYLAQDFSLRNADVPTMKGIPRPVLRMYWQAYRGGWFDTYQRGYGKITSYDISSAYPWALTQLPNVQHGKWVKGVVDESNLGVAAVTLTQRARDCLPVAVQRGGRNIYPLPDVPIQTYLTLAELRTYETAYDIQVHKAFSFIPSPDADYPYQKLIDKLYALKQSHPKQSVEYMLYKRIMNSMYGKTAELIKTSEGWTWGKLFHPIYAAEITALTRTKMYDAIHEHASSVVSILTDGVMFSEPIELKTGKGLGAFELQHENVPCVVLQTGVYQYENETPATRGFSRKNNLWDLRGVSTPTFRTKTLRPLHYRECIKRKDFERIGEFIEVEKVINVDHDLKRLWPQRNQPLSSLLSKLERSNPVPASLLPPSR